MDKSLMINQIMEYLNLSTDVSFSKFLGIKPTVLANWRKRNTLNADLIFTKCEDISLTWLVTGKGEMLAKNSKDKFYAKNDSKNEIQESHYQYHSHNSLISLLIEKDKTIKVLHDSIETYKNMEKYLNKRWQEDQEEKDSLKAIIQELENKGGFSKQNASA